MARTQASGGTGLLRCADQAGFTPVSVARTYRHLLVADRLERDADALQRRTAPGFKGEALFAPAAWVAGVLTLSVFVWKVTGPSHVIPPPAPWMHVAAMVAVLSTALGFIALWQLNVGDPGIVPARKEGGGDATLTYLDCAALRAGQWKQLCVTCKIVRPLRAKHDVHTGHCVETFDHYCPWVGNAIGRRNRHYFLAFVVLELVSELVGCVTTILRLHQSRVLTYNKRSGFEARLNSESGVLLLWIVLNLPLCFGLLNLAWFQGFQVRAGPAGEPEAVSKVLDLSHSPPTGAAQHDDKRVHELAAVSALPAPADGAFLQPLRRRRGGQPARDLLPGPVRHRGGRAGRGADAEAAASRVGLHVVLQRQRVPPPITRAPNKALQSGVLAASQPPA